jgi:cation diffusion facilitator family transporter
VIVAGAANVLVGLAKLVAGIMTGSSAMLAEAAHSAADTLDQVFLLMSLRQADRPATREHPFGHGQERYFWSLLAAFGIFIAGAGFSVFEGILALTRNQHESALLAYVALGIAVVAEGTSFARAYWTRDGIRTARAARDAGRSGRCVRRRGAGRRTGLLREPGLPRVRLCRYRGPHGRLRRGAGGVIPRRPCAA